MSVKIKIPQDKIIEFCGRNHIRRLALFGSVLREDFTPESDIDLLVEFEQGARVGFFELFDMEQEFSNFLNDRKVDIHTPNSLSKYFRDKVLREAEIAYERS
jgi:predicted nucleotidyltransferase